MYLYNACPSSQIGGQRDESANTTLSHNGYGRPGKCVYLIRSLSSSSLSAHATDVSQRVFVRALQFVFDAVAITTTRKSCIGSPLAA